jgi:hypothetical protein
MKQKWINSTNTPTYNSWRSMRNRCLFNNKNSKHYKNKNITICDEWLNNYDTFFTDMGERPFGTTLDRLDNSGNYNKSNCRWASNRTQQNNKESLTKVEHNGIVKTIGEWCFELDLDNTQIAKVYKRHSRYNCTTFTELFHEGALLSKRVNERDNKCKICSTDKSIKWRKYGDLCNTCYHRALRWSKRNSVDIEKYHEWKHITWKTTYS